MKTIKRKLLSLLLAMAMVLTLVPTALASSPDSGGSQNPDPTTPVTYTVAPNSTSLKVGTAATFTATPPSGTTAPADASYEWTVDNNKQSSTTNSMSYTPTSTTQFTVSVTVSANGSTVGTGSATFTASEDSQPPVSADPANVTLSSPSATLTVGGSTSVTATVTDSQNNKLEEKDVTVTLASGSSAINGLTVSAGKTNAQGVATISISTTASAATGSTKYTVKCGNVTATNDLTITVNAAATATPTFIISANPTSILSNGQATLTIPNTTSTGAAMPAYTSVEWAITAGSTYATLNSATTTLGTNTLIGRSSSTGGTVTISATAKNSSGATVATGTGTVAVGSANPATLVGTPSNANPIYLDNWTNSTGTGYQVFSVTPYLNNVPIYNPTSATYTWSVNNKAVSTYNNSSFDLTSYNSDLKYGNTANYVKCDAQFTYGGQSYGATITWTVYTGYDNYLASVNVANSYNYALGDRDDAGNSSIVDQLASRYYYGSSYGASYVQFKTTTSAYGTLNASINTNYYLTSSTSGSYSYLGNVIFTPSSTAGKAVFSVRVYYGNAANSYVDGTICFDTSGTTTSGDINYTGTIGQDVYFDAGDFEDLYYDKTSGGSLSYVTFSTASSGTGSLYSGGGRLSSGTQCYVSPTTRQTALDSVYFSPSSTTASKGGTVRLSFTAYGTGGRYSSRTITGTVVINYLNGSARDITYTPVNSTVSLKASDFTEAYRQVMGSTAPTDLTIQFQDAPTYGTLSYRNSSSSSSSAVNLRSSNIKSYRFTTRTSGANRLEDVTYTVSGARSDTIEYIAYSNGAARFTGKVVFNPSTASTSVIISKVCAGSTGIAFNLADFTAVNPTVMANTATVRFTMPASGVLTYAGATVTYTGASVPVSMMSQVYYRPNAGFNGTDRVAFVCMDASGNQTGSGQVNIVVSGNTSTGSNTGVTSISQFTDLPKDGSASWYTTELADLVSKGIVQGTGNGKAEPRKTLNYGEALKMILRAAGYPAQAEPAGNDWAINYKTLAVNNGIVSSNVVLTDPISRDAVVEMIAKALKISPVTGNSPFTDSNNGYAIALNRTTPQIIVGNANGTFNGSGTLLRQEVWVIVYRMNQYVDNQYSTQMPDGI